MGFQLDEVEFGASRHNDPGSIQVGLWIDIRLGILIFHTHMTLRD